MAVTESTHTGNNSTTQFPFTFPYLKSTDIEVQVDATVKTVGTDWFLANATTVQFNTAPTTGEKIKILRQTNVDNLTATFYAGSSIKSEDLNDNYTQNLYKTQEVGNRYFSNTGGTMNGDLTMGEDAVIVFEGATDDAHETTLTVADPTADRTITFPNVTGTIVTTGDTGTVTSTMLTDATIVDADINASAEITVSKLKDGAARQVLQTDSGGTGVEWTDNLDLPGTLDVTGATTLDGTLNVTGASTHATVDINGGAIDGTTIGANSAAAGTFTNGTITTADINGGNIDGTVIGASSTAAGSFTTVNASSTITGNVTGNVTGNADTATDLAAATKITNSEQAAHTANDTTYFTTSASDARYFNISSGDTIKDGVTFPDNDTTIATTAAINDRIIDLVDDVGGFWPIANETSFPTANPDVNNGTGTLVSIKEFAASHTPSSGSVTIANGAGSGNTVTITGCGSTVLAAGFGGIVETTSTLHTYTFHRLTPKATEVTTVAGISGNVTTVAGISGNVTTVAGIASNVTSVAGNATNINTVAANNTNVTTVGTNIADVNNFADLYQISTSAPSNDGGGNALASGDLWFDSSSNKSLKVHNGTAFQAVSPTQSVLTDIAIVSGNITYAEDLGLIVDALETGTGNSIPTVASAITNVNTVATNIANVNAVAADATDIGAVAGKATEIGLLGTSAAVADMAILGTADVVADMNTLATADVVADLNTLGTADVVADLNTLGTADVVTDMNTLGTADCVSDMNTLGTATNVTNMNTLAGISSNITTVAGISANVTTVAGVSANVTTVAGSIADVNRYANEYKIAGSAPGSPSSGDLWYDGTNNVLKYRDSSAWVGISPGIASVSDDTSPTLGGNLDADSNNISNGGTFTASSFVGALTGTATGLSGSPNISVGTISGTNLQIDFGSIA